jgi:hypothetical protein
MQMKVAHDGKRHQPRSFQPGDAVMVRNFRGSERWKPGLIMQCLGPVSYMVKVQDQLRHVHIDHLISGTENFKDPLQEFDPTDILVPPAIPHEVPRPPHVPNIQPVILQQNGTQSTAMQSAARNQDNRNRNAENSLRRNPRRHCGAPVKLDL